MLHSCLLRKIIIEYQKNIVIMLVDMSSEKRVVTIRCGMKRNTQKYLKESVSYVRETLRHKVNEKLYLNTALRSVCI
tara:strand:- start:11486 stop:11716 length:231 start_codon:yes stop_codon:yes gene_type:complete